MQWRRNSGTSSLLPCFAPIAPSLYLSSPTIRAPPAYLRPLGLFRPFLLSPSSFTVTWDYTLLSDSQSAYTPVNSCPFHTPRVTQALSVRYVWRQPRPIMTREREEVIGERRIDHFGQYLNEKTHPKHRHWSTSPRFCRCSMSLFIARQYCGTFDPFPVHHLFNIWYFVVNTFHSVGNNSVVPIIGRPTRIANHSVLVRH